MVAYPVFEIKACWNEPLTMEVKVDISRWFDIDEIYRRLSKLPWTHRVVHIDFGAMTRGMEIIIELNETGFNQERKNNMPPKENHSGYFATVKNNQAIIDILNYGLGGPMKIVRVAFNGPATIVFWADGTKTIVKCMEGEKFDPEKGLAMAICKRLYGDDFHRVFKDTLKNADMKCSDEAKMARENRVLKAKKKEIIQAKAKAKKKKMPYDYT